jgi:ABC-type transport system involved in multi-copper enzyme maturation permease subunit
MKMILKYIFLTALRDWLYIGLLIILSGAFGISSLIGQTALSEEIPMQTVYFASTARIITICGMILFICFHIKRSFENKEIQFILSKPISRYKFIIAYWISFNIISLLLITPIVLTISIFSSANLASLSFWTLSLILELLLISTFAIVSSFILESAVSSVLATFSFYLLARMMGFFVYAVAIPKTTAEISSFIGFNKSLLKFLSVLFPRLDLFTKSDWLLYGIQNYGELNLILIQSLIYIPLMLSIAFFDFKRKQF